MIHSLMVKDHIYEGRYILSIRDGRVFVRDTKESVEKELAVSGTDLHLSSGTITSSGVLKLQILDQSNIVEIDISSYLSKHFISFEGTYGSSVGDIATQSDDDKYLKWGGSGWYLEEESIHDGPRSLQDLNNVSSGSFSIQEGTLLIGNGNSEFKTSNPRSTNPNSSGFVRWDTTNSKYSLDDIPESMKYVNGILDLMKTDGTIASTVSIKPVTINSSGLGTFTASTDDYIVWSDSSGQWIPETRLDFNSSLPDAFKDSRNLVSASGIYEFTESKINENLAGASLSFVDLTVENQLTSSGILTNTLTASSGIVSSGNLDTQTLTTTTLVASSGIRLSSGSVEIDNGNLILSNNIEASGNITVEGSGTFDQLTANDITVSSGFSTTTMESNYLKVSSSGYNPLFTSGTEALTIDFNNNSSYYFSDINLQSTHTLSKLSIKNGVPGAQAVISLHGSGTISNSIIYIDGTAEVYMAPIGSAIQLSDTAEAVLTIHYTRNKPAEPTSKPVYYVVVSELEKQV